MATQRPLLPLLVTVYQTAQEHPLGAQARQIEDALTREAQNVGEEPVPRPTQKVALRQAVELGVLRAEGERRGRRYFPGTENPGTWSEEVLAEKLGTLVGGSSEEGGVHPVPKATSGQATRTRKTKGKTRKAREDASAVISTGPLQGTPTPVHAQQFKKLQALVWSIADTLRDKSNLQVDGFRPVTLMLLTLKRGMDTQTALQTGGWIGERLEKQAALLDSGMLTGVGFADQVNQKLEIYDPVIFGAQHPDRNKAGVVMMHWKDLLTFKGSENGQRRESPVEIPLAVNPPGKRRFSYATQAGNLKQLLEELVGLHVADLREAFGAIGLHAALVPADPNAPRLSEGVLLELVDRLSDIDLSVQAVPGDVFSDVYMDLLGRFAADSGKKGGDFFTPVPLVQGSLRFLPIEQIAQDLINDPDRKIAIADPTAGSFTFLTQAYDAIQRAVRNIQGADLERRKFIFHAQELTSIQAGLGVFNFFFHGLATRLAPVGEDEETNGRSPSAGGAVARIVGNSISEYVPKIGHQAGKIDLALANPPYGTADYGIDYARNADPHKDARWHVGQPTRSEGEWAFINTVVDLLSPTGKGLIVLPLGALFRDSGKAFRQFLIEKNWIEGVVALPGNQFLTTSIPVCLLLLNKETGEGARAFDGSPRQHGVFFVNAANDFTKTGKFNHWDQDAAVEAWWAREEKPGYSGFVPVEKLRDARNDYNLSVNRYFAPIQARVVHDPVVLADQATVLRDRIALRTAWFDGDDVYETGLWQQAVAASAEAAAGGEPDGEGV